MTLSKIGRVVMALVATAALGLGMTACGGGTIGYMWVLGTYYNQISGFLIDNYTGNLTDWAANTHAIPSLDIELTNHSGTDFDQNLRVLQVFLSWKQ